MIYAWQRMHHWRESSHDVQLVRGASKLNNSSGCGVLPLPERSQCACASKGWAMRELQNSDANHLSMPLPRGKIRFYTPKDERIRVFTASAFDLTGECKRTVFLNDMGRRSIDEGFKIKVRNHKKEAVEARVAQHLNQATRIPLPRPMRRRWSSA